MKNTFSPGIPHPPHAREQKFVGVPRRPGEVKFCFLTFGVGENQVFWGGRGRGGWGGGGAGRGARGAPPSLSEWF